MDLPDVSVAWVTFVSVTVLLFTYFWFPRRNYKYPPTPLRAWPIFGNVLQLNTDPREQFSRFRKQCGDIYSLQLGSKYAVILSGYEVTKEAYVKLGDGLSDRVTTYADFVNDGVNKGIIASNGVVWKENRAFALSVLKNFGFGKNVLAERIQEEINHFIDVAENLNGNPSDIQPFITICASNVMCSILVGQTYAYDDTDFLKILKLISTILSKLQGTKILHFFPWLRHLTGDLFGCRMIQNCFNNFWEMFVHVHIKKNENCFEEPGNFVAAYIQEMKNEELANQRTKMDKSNLMRMILDLFVAGTETTASTLGFFVLYMVNYPDVQEKIFHEIVQVVGLERGPRIQDRGKLVYLTASIMEIQRLVNVIPINIPRLVPRDVNLRGYHIPRGTLLILDNEFILRDTSLWGDDSNNFRPERFIDESGSLITPEAWIPFSLGRRSCLGESLAKMELFLFVSNIIQKFQILAADPSIVPPVKGHFGVTHAPLPYKVKLVCRRSRL